MNTESLAELASRQHGAVGVRQLRDLGISARAQRAMTTSRRIARAAPGVVTLAGSADTWHRKLQIGLLALGSDAWVSHEAAAALHGLDRSRSVLEFTIRRGGRVVDLAGATVHTTTEVGGVDVIRVAGFRCTSATRTILDLAASNASTDRLAAAIDSAVRLHLSAPLVIMERLAQRRGPGHHGVALVDRLLVDAGGETMLERHFLRLVRTAGLPRPQTQRRIRSDGRHIARVDFLFAEQRLVVEVSGRLGHSSPPDRARDAQRRNELQDLGFAVYEYTWADVTRRADYVVATLTHRLMRRSPALLM